MLPSVSSPRATEAGVTHTPNTTASSSSSLDPSSSSSVPLTYINEDHTISGLLRRFLQEVWKEKELKQLFGFVCVLLVYITAEFIHGIQVGSLGLISDAFHNTFHSIAMMASLTAMVLARTPPSFEFSYGYDRYEVLASFTASTCLLFVCLFVAVQGTHRVINPVEIDSSHTLEFGLAGFVINVAGIFLFGRRSKLLSRTQQVLPSHSLATQAVYLHVFTDAFASLAVISSALLMKWNGWHSMDALQSLAVVLLTLYSVVPLFKETGLLLVQRRPSHLKGALDRCRREASSVDGVLECNEEHYWTQSPGVVVGSISVRVRSNADEQAILTTIHKIFHRYCTHLTIQVEKDPPLDWLTGGGGGVEPSPPPHA